MERPVFLLGAHKSGSSLLRSLLDGHPELFVVPFEAHFFEAAHYWVDYQLRRARPPVLPLEDMKTALVEVARRYNSHVDPTSDATLKGQLDIARLESALRVETTSFAETVSLYVRAVYISLFHQELAPGLRIVEKSVENAEFAQDLKHMFPDAQFVHIIRNPYANLVSLRRKETRWRFPLLGPKLLALKNSYYWLYRNRRFIDDYHVIRYEDLVAKPEPTIRGVAHFLGLTFTETLLQPTSLGRPWGGNSSRGLQFSRVAPENLELWRTEITPLEAYYVTRFFNFVLEAFSYERFKTTRTRFWPNWREDPLTYVANRLVSYYL